MFESFMKGKAYDPASVEGVDDLPYAIPNLAVESHKADVKVPVQWWRSVGHSHTGFATECFIDELAALAQKDPYQYQARFTDQASSTSCCSRSRRSKSWMGQATAQRPGPWNRRALLI